MNPVHSSDSDSDSDFDSDFDHMLDNVAEEVPASVDAESPTPSRLPKKDNSLPFKHFKKPEFVASPAFANTPLPIKCDLVLVGTTSCASSFLHHTFGIAKLKAKSGEASATNGTETSNPSIVGTITFNRKGSKEIEHATVHSISLPSSSMTIFYISLDSELPSEYSGPVAKVITSTFSAQCIAVLSSLPLAAHHHAEFTVINTSRTVKTSEIDAFDLPSPTKAPRLNPLVQNRSENCPPLLYLLQSTHISSLYSPVSTEQLRGSRGQNAVSCNEQLQQDLFSNAAIGWSGTSQDGLKLENSSPYLSIPFLPAPNQLFGLEAAILQRCELEGVPSIIYSSVDDIHNYSGESLFAFESAISHLFSLFPAATNQLLSITSKLNRTLPAKAQNRVRHYRDIRQAFEDSVISLKYRDVGQHKLLHFTNKPIPSGLFC